MSQAMKKKTGFKDLFEKIVMLILKNNQFVEFVSF